MNKIKNDKRDILIPAVITLLITLLILIISYVYHDTTTKTEQCKQEGYSYLVYESNDIALCCGRINTDGTIDRNICIKYILDGKK